MNRGVTLAAIALCAAIAAGCVSVNLRTAPQPLKETPISGEGRDKILLIDIAGFISGERRGGGVLGVGEQRPSMVSEIAEVVRTAERDKRIKGVILRINSPGGTVTASDTIYHELAAYKQRTQVPMTAQILDLGASGAYYIAQVADRIVAQPTTITGSIGVIMVRPSVTGLLDKLGVQTEQITSGTYKGMGSPLTPMRDDERAIFQAVIDDLYTRFVATIVAGRPHLTPERVAALADGRIYTAQQAKETGLVDDIGYLQDSINALKRTAKLDRVRVVTYTRTGAYQGSLYGGPVVNVDLGVMPAHPGFLYLWQP